MRDRQRHGSCASHKRLHTHLELGTTRHKSPWHGYHSTTKHHVLTVAEIWKPRLRIGCVRIRTQPRRKARRAEHCAARPRLLRRDQREPTRGAWKRRRTQPRVRRTSGEVSQKESKERESTNTNQSVRMRE